MKNQNRYRPCFKRTVQEKGIEVSELYTHVCENVTQIQRVRNNEILKRGKSSLMIFERHANPKYKYVNRHFWSKGILYRYNGKE